MVPTLVHAYNCTRCTATGFSPYYLMYGQKPQLLVDLYFGTQNADMNTATSTSATVMCKTEMGLKTAQHCIEKETRDISKTMITK